MTVYEAIEDEFARALEAGARPPKQFTLTFAEPEFLALLGSIVCSRTNLPMPTNTQSVQLDLYGYDVTILRGGDSYDTPKG